MKAFLRVLFLSLVLGLIVGPQFVSAQWGSGPVVVYDQKDGRGTGQWFNVGTYRADRGQFGSLRNDSARSVNVSNGYHVRVCENEGSRSNGEGRCEEWGPGLHNLKYQASASFIQVTGSGWNPGGGGNPGRGDVFGGRTNYRSGGVTVFEDPDLRGREQFFGIGHYLAGAGQFGELRNDKASSVYVPRGYKVKFCENEGTDARGSGRCEEHGEGTFNLRYNDEASYIEVQKAGSGWGNWGGGRPGGIGIGGNPERGGNDVIVFSGRDQSGTEQAFGVGTYRNDLRQFGRLRNDDASSVYVPRGYRVRLCAGEGGGAGEGPCEEYGAGSYNLRYNDKASYIRVWRGN